MPRVSNFNTKLFADDTVLTLTNLCPRLLNKKVNSKLVKIDEWLKLNKLSLNTNKTKFMVLTKQRSARHFDIKIGKTNIEQVNEIVLGTGARPVVMGLPRVAWVKLNCLRTGVR